MSAIERDEMPSLEDVDKMLNEVIGPDPSIEELVIARILFFSAWLGENDAALAAMCRIPVEHVFGITSTLIKNGVFGRSADEHYKDYMENNNSGICLNCDVACGKGHLKRGTKSPTEPTWVITTDGLEYVTKELLPGLVQP